jgi:hypothetical protein
MNIVLVVGVTISILGLIGLVVCIGRGLQIRRFERFGAHTQDELKRLLGQLSVINMLSLSLSFLGLLIVVVSLIFNT